MICPYCKKETDVNSRFCGNCGKFLDLPEIPAKNSAPKKNAKGIIITVLGGVFAAFVIFIVIGAMLSKSDFSDKSSTEEKEEVSPISKENFPEGENIITETTDKKQSKNVLTKDQVLGMLMDGEAYKGKKVEALPVKVFNIIGYSEGSGYQFQGYTDIFEKTAVLIVSDEKLSLQANDYVLVDGTVKGTHKGTNAFGGTVYNSVIYASKIQAGDFTILNPAVKTLEVNGTIEQSGLSVTLEKVELSENSTRLYLYIVNNTGMKAGVQDYGNYIVQNAKQYNDSGIISETIINPSMVTGTVQEAVLSIEPIDSLEIPFTIGLSPYYEDIFADIDEFVFNIEPISNVPAQEPLDPGILYSLSSEERKELNLFLSNFAETNLFYIDGEDEDSLLDFGIFHNIINSNKVKENGNQQSLEAAFVEKAVEGYLGKGIKNHSTDTFEYGNGMYYWERIEDSYLKFVQANSLTENEDGTYTVTFSVYDASPYSDDRVPEELYCPKEEWGSLAEDNVSYYIDGNAHIKREKAGEKYTYKLLFYALMAQ